MLTELFAGAAKKAALKAAQAALVRSTHARGKKTKFTFQYELHVLKDGGKKKDVISKTSKKNTLTLKNLTPASYTAKYRVQIMKKENGRVTPAGKTTFSPTAAFTIS